MALGNDIQFGRYASVKFTNFDSGLESTVVSAKISGQEFIGDGLRISFEYTKQRDEVVTQSNGKIIIYGLTESTFSAIGERLRCEIEVVGGYVKSTSNPPQTLFKAILMDKSFEVQNDITVATFEVWGDFQYKFIGSQKKLNFTVPVPYFGDIAEIISKGMGLEGWSLSLDGTDEEVEAQIEYFTKIKVAEFGYAMWGTPQQELKRLRNAIGIGYKIVGKQLVFEMIESVRQSIIQRGKFMLGTQNQESTALFAENKQPQAEAPKDSGTSKINIFQTHALLLSNDNGLIGTPIFKTVIADTGYGAALQNGEEVWQKKEQKVLLDKDGKPKVDKKTGEVKLSKQARYMKVSRRTVLVKCFINGAIDYNAMIQLQTEAGIVDGLYRVREIKISGDTEGNSWYMELELNET